MSFDLLAEFAKPSSTAASQRPSKPPAPAPAPAGSGPAYQPGRNQWSFFDDLNELNQPAKSSSTPASPSNFGAFGSLASRAPAGQLTSGPVPAAATASAQPPPPPPPAQSSSNNDEDDDWGDFADAPSAQPPATLSFANTTQTQTVQPDPWDSLRTVTARTTATPSSTPAPPVQLQSNPQPEDDDPFGLGLLPNQSTHSKKPNVQSLPVSRVPEKKPSPPPRDPNVLFDAENLSEDDDFGDFEGTPAEEKPGPSQFVEPAKPVQPAPTTMALNIDSLINDLELSGGLSAKAPTSKRQDWKQSTTAKLAAKAQSRPGSTSTPISSTGTSPGPPAARKLRPAAQPIPLDDEDEWADFTETAPPNTASSQPTLPAGITIPSTPNSPPDPLPNALPPTNIPPPFLLLNLFPPIFASAQTRLFKPLGAQPPAVRAQILSHERTLRFLRSYLSIGVVVGRIIAGRKLRWKRDAYLAQGMSIGPAGRAGGGGMKVVKLDRGEERREDSQVEEVVRAWREQVGRLRSLMVQVNSNAGGRLSAVPEVAETMAVRTAKESEGGVPATRACALCGLKRNERVAKVDVDVEDSFGEWWVEGVCMHRACRNFWEGNKERLKGV